jgi:hypothetical protein
VKGLAIVDVQSSMEYDQKKLCEVLVVRSPPDDPALISE